MVDQWIEEIKRDCDPQSLGMILVHNGIVRATSKEGKPVAGMVLTYDEELLESTARAFRKKDGIAAIKIWINRGELHIGDDIMYVLVAGRFRTDVLPVLQELLTIVKTRIVQEKEISQ